jgi:two-component system, LuxR family, sensor kinase FixL
MPLPLHRQTPPLWDDSLFETVVAAAINGVMAVNEHGLISVFNAACEAMFQFQREEVLGHGIAMLLASPYREEYEERLYHYQQTGEAKGAGKGRELIGRRKDGAEFPIFLSVGEGVHDGRRTFVVVIQDLTDLQLERAIHAEQRAFLAAIVDSANDAIISKTLDGKITSWNRAAEDLFGYSATEMIGMPITRLFPEDRLHEEAEILERIRAGHALEHYETVRVRKDGTLVDVSVTVSPIRDMRGQVIGASKTVRDITDRKQAEARMQSLSAELNHVARVSEMGQVSAAIAHELNQPLTAVLNYTNVAKRLIASIDPAAKAKSYEAVSKAGEQALRAGQIIRRLRDFVEKRESTRTLEDVNAVTEDALALGLIGIGATDIKTSLALASNLPPVLVDKVQIQQVLVNLLRNAAEAMMAVERRELTVTTAPGTGEWVQVSVADTGCGISEELAERLFHPFVTTKVGGMGIGLAISRSIVESHGGLLTMVSNPGGGTVFQFILPVTQRVVD